MSSDQLVNVDSTLAGPVLIVVEMAYGQIKEALAAKVGHDGGPEEQRQGPVRAVQNPSKSWTNPNRCARVDLLLPVCKYASSKLIHPEIITYVRKNEISLF